MIQSDISLNRKNHQNATTSSLGSILFLQWDLLWLGEIRRFHPIEVRPVHHLVVSINVGTPSFVWFIKFLSWEIQKLSHGWELGIPPWLWKPPCGVPLFTPVPTICHHFLAFIHDVPTNTLVCVGLSIAMFDCRTVNPFCWWISVARPVFLTRGVPPGDLFCPGLENHYICEATRDL